MRGPIAFVGGGEFQRPARDLDDWLLGQSRDDVVTILPTAAANEKPNKAVETATKYFDAMGASTRAVMVLDSSDADSPKLAAALEDSSFIYIAGGDPLHLLETLRSSRALGAIVSAWEKGAVLAGSSAGAMVLGDPMLIPGANEPVRGLGLFSNLLVVPHFSKWGRRIIQVAKAMVDSVRILALDDATGLVVNENECMVLGAGSAYMFRDGEQLWAKVGPAKLKGCLNGLE